MKDLPETDDAVAQWCKDMFVAKVSTDSTSHALTGVSAATKCSYVNILLRMVFEK